MTDKERQATFLMVVFEQSWQYVRHAQSMFWQSFAALLTVISGILYVTYTNADADAWMRLFGYLSAAALALVGYLVTMRAMIVVKEHLITINRVRRECGLEDLGVILPRWQRYELQDFPLTKRRETFYMVIAQQIYVIMISVLAFASGYPSRAVLWEKLIIALPWIACLLTFVVLEYYVWKVLWPRDEPAEEGSTRRDNEDRG